MYLKEEVVRVGSLALDHLNDLHDLHHDWVGPLRVSLKHKVSLYQKNKSKITISFSQFLYMSNLCRRSTISVVDLQEVCTGEEWFWEWAVKVNNSQSNYFINWAEIHNREQVTTRKAGINNMVMQMRGDKITQAGGNGLNYPIFQKM